jgi:molecular chaperone DnaK (HSP70)
MIQQLSRYLVGIDLGTTNTVVAYAAPGAQLIQLFEIEQLSAPGALVPAPLLPSVRYHAAPGELAAGDLQLPWPPAAMALAASATHPPTSAPAASTPATEVPDPALTVFGRWARSLGTQVPGRLVASAKSWLSHPAVDRLAPILPWGAGADVAKISPVAASASYLAYVRAAWDCRFPDHPLARQELVLTVPASFDEGARALTLQAAQQAGLPNVRLLEEPQAVFYDWLFRHRARLDTELAAARLVLVCDVGGGTTDLSLIKVEPQADGPPQLTRIGVGNHLMLGGDNMDLALAHLIETRMNGVASTPKLSAGRLSQLIERCRAAKEQLLAAQAPDSTTVTLLGSGAKLIGGSRSVELSRAETEQLVVDGFFPQTGPNEHAKRGRSGIVEFGLPYASDPAITRHLAGFLHQHAVAVREALGPQAPPAGQLAIPDTLLLNGGVFRAAPLVERVRHTLGAWRGAALHLLHNDNPDIAVARGAVAYTLARQGNAPKIGGGSARSYFLILDPARSKGAKTVTQRAICILPRGAEAGREILLPARQFALRLGQPVRFHLLSSTAEAADLPPPRLGDIIELDQSVLDDFVALPPIATVLHADGDGAPGARQDIPVQLTTTLTEVGTLDMHCVSIDRAAQNAGQPGQRWRLEFQLRHAPDDAVADSDTMAEPALPANFSQAIEKIDRIFGPRPQPVSAKEVKQLRAQLEQLLGNRERWHTALLRQLFDALLQRMRGRRRSVEHERAWLNLTGYCLRPGFGYPLDEWRITQLWPLFEQGVQHASDNQVCSEWWTLWRRVAGGLDAAAQLRLLDDFALNVQGSAEDLRQRPPHSVGGSADDMLLLGASLERIPASYKAEIGAWLLTRIDPAYAQKLDAAETQDSRTLWALGRIGARQPFYGSAHDVVDPDTVSTWLTVILALDWRRLEPAAFAAAHLARMTGDRSRDLAPDLREQIIRRLQAIDAPPDWIAMVREVVQLDEANQKRMLGEALPPGLKLIESAP